MNVAYKNGIRSNNRNVIKFTIINTLTKLNKVAYSTPNVIVAFI